MSGYRRLAAVDLGSNSFRLLIGRAEHSALGETVLPLDSLKQTVRLASGLRDDGMLDTASRDRALAALALFGDRLRSFGPDVVRAVATNTLRVARNAGRFLASAEAALGFPIEVVSGLEEARLIYLGAAHALPDDGQARLVVDIGGGSTECIVGTGMQADVLESAAVGCVALSTRYFADGRIDREVFEHACYAARAVFAQVAEPFRRSGWRYAVGTSGTAKSLCQIARAQWNAAELDHDALARIRDALLDAGHVDAVQFAGLKTDRRPVLAGGLAAMTAAFDELGIEAMRYCGGALRQGVLYDLLGRSEGRDMRTLTVERMLGRYGVDRHHARRVRDTALGLFDQGANDTHEAPDVRRQLLGWAAELAEVGMSISHEGFHKHSAYIVGHADMPGFSQREQAALARLVLGQLGGLRKLRATIDDELDRMAVVALRVATILHRERDDREVPMPALSVKRRTLRLSMPKQWALRFPLAHASLLDEAAAWAELRVFEKFVYETI